MKVLHSLSRNHLLRVRDFTALKGYKLFYNYVSLENLKDVEIFPPIPQFLDVEKLYVQHCCPNFVTTWLRESVFPNVREIHLETSSPDLTERFDCKIFASGVYACHNGYLTGATKLDDILNSYGLSTIISENIEES
jgi:hypothetical protein